MAVALVLALTWRRDAALVLGGLVLLVVGADLLVAGAVNIARSMGISPLVIGLTVVAFGTSAPELAASVRSALVGKGDLAVGNILGSNIANICLILGLTAIFRPIPIATGIVRRDVPIMIGVTALGILVLGGGTVSRFEGVILSLGIVGFVLYMFFEARREGDAGEHHLGEIVGDEPKQQTNIPASVAILLAGIGLLVLGADVLVRGATSLATAMGVSSAVIGLSVVAFGTSLPELATSLTAAFKRESDLAVGNILGSNVFNLLCVMGLSAVARPLEVPAEAMARDVWVMGLASLACLPMLTSARRISRGEGTILFVFYVGYIAAIYWMKIG